MQRSIIRIALILCSLVSWLIPGTASASPGLTVNGALFEADVSPGENITHDIKISLSDDKKPVTINLEVGGFGQNPDGTCNPVEANKDIFAYSACSFITLDTYTLRLNSGETRHVKASIRIPSDVSDGGKYAVIRLSNQSDDKKQLSVALSINIPILLTLSNSTPVHTGQVESINISKILNHKPIELYTDYKNTGNHHYKIRGIMYIKDNSDKVLATLYSSAGVTSILPEQLRRIKFSFIPTNSLPLGNYRVESVVISEDNQILAQKEIALDITETYQPPVPIASIVVKPTSEATIKTSDEQISVTFPAGSVTADAGISLTLYSKEQLPEAA
ncbi:MAG: hypothetical protein NTV30_00525, partial [Chloroflexi bacterium]|nr:hypothetical protein [Chloroflexota bacterium]